MSYCWEGHKSQKYISFSKSIEFTNSASAYNPSALSSLHYTLQCDNACRRLMFKNVFSLIGPRTIQTMQSNKQSYTFKH